LREVSIGEAYTPSPLSYDVRPGVDSTHVTGPRATIGKHGRDLVPNSISPWELAVGPSPAEYRDIARSNDDAHELTIRTKRNSCNAMFGKSRSLRLTKYSSGGVDGQLGADTASVNAHEPNMGAVKRQHARTAFAQGQRPFLQQNLPCAVGSAATVPSPLHYRPNMLASQPLPFGGRMGRAHSTLHSKSILPVESQACRGDQAGAYKAAISSTASLFTNNGPNKYNTKLDVYKKRQPSHVMLGRHGTRICGRDWLHSSCN